MIVQAIAFGVIISSFSAYYHEPFVLKRLRVKHLGVKQSILLCPRASMIVSVAFKLGARLACFVRHSASHGGNRSIRLLLIMCFEICLAPEIMIYATFSSKASP